MKYKILSLIFLVFINVSLKSQNEKNNTIEIKGGDLMKALNNTKWKLSGVYKKKGLFMRKRQPVKEELVILTFKEGIVSYSFSENKTTHECKYSVMWDDQIDASMRLFIDCNDIQDPYWVVYKLNDAKLVTDLYGPDKGFPNQKFLGKHVYTKVD